MISFRDDEQKREFIQAFNKYVSLERQKKQLSADTRITFTDFFNRVFTGLDKFSKKEKKKEFNLCSRTKEELKTDKEILEGVEQLRMSHLELDEDDVEYYDQIIDDKLTAKRQAKQITEEQKELFTIMRKSIIETDEVAKAVINALVKEALGKLGMMDRISTGVEEGKAILFNIEANEEGEE